MRTEGAGAFSPLNRAENHAGFSPGPEGPLILRPNFVGLKPHAPSVQQLAKLLYTIERTALAEK